MKHLNIWPKFESSEDALRTCRGVAIAAGLVGFFSIVGVLMDKLPTEAVFDSSITIICGLFMYFKQSRAAAVTLLTLAILNTIYKVLNGLPAGFFSIALMFIYVAGVRSSFAFHKLTVK